MVRRGYIASDKYSQIFVVAGANIRTHTNIAKTNIRVCKYLFCANNTREWRVYSILVPYLAIEYYI
jgi:hypothetical protein